MQYSKKHQCLNSGNERPKGQDWTDKRRSRKRTPISKYFLANGIELLEEPHTPPILVHVLATFSYIISFLLIEIALTIINVAIS